MSAIGREIDAESARLPRDRQPSGRGDPRGLRRATTAGFEEITRRARDAVRAARLARRPGRRHRAAGALPHPRRRRRGRRARHPAGRGHGADALGRHARAPRAGRPGPARRGAGPDVLQLGDPPGVQHRGRGRRPSSTSTRPRAARRRRRAAALRPRPGGRRWTPTLVRRILERFPWSVPYASPAARRRDRGAARSTSALDGLPARGPIELDVVRSVFYRNKGAYVVGRIRRGGVGAAAGAAAAPRRAGHRGGRGAA